MAFPFVKRLLFMSSLPFAWFLIAILSVQNENQLKKSRDHCCEYDKKLSNKDRNIATILYCKKRKPIYKLN